MTRDLAHFFLLTVRSMFNPSSYLFVQILATRAMVVSRAATLIKNLTNRNILSLDK